MPHIFLRRLTDRYSVDHQFLSSARFTPADRSPYTSNAAYTCILQPGFIQTISGIFVPRDFIHPSSSLFVPSLLQLNPFLGKHLKEQIPTGVCCISEACQHD